MAAASKSVATAVSSAKASMASTTNPASSNTASQVMIPEAMLSSIRKQLNLSNDTPNEKVVEEWATAFIQQAEKITSLNSDYDVIFNQCDAQRLRIEKMEESQSQYVLDRKKETESQTAASQLVDKLNEGLSNKQNEIDQFRKSAKEKENETASTINQLTVSVSAKDNTISQLQSAAATKQSEMDNLQQKMVQLKNDHATSLDSILTTHKKTVTSLQAEVDKRDQTITDNASTIADLRSKYDTMRADLKVANTRVETIEAGRRADKKLLLTATNKVLDKVQLQADFTQTNLKLQQQLTALQKILAANNTAASASSNMGSDPNSASGAGIHHAYQHTKGSNGTNASSPSTAASLPAASPTTVASSKPSSNVSSVSTNNN